VEDTKIVLQMPQVSILNVLINQDLQELIKQKKREEEEERSRKML